MFIIDIEGDNGTGKDTIAHQLQKLNYEILTYQDDLVELSRLAKTYSGKERVKKFIEYCHTCSKQIQNVKESKKDIILVRYWISTLAAAYADYIYDYDYVMQLANEFDKQLIKPNLIIRLLCDFDIRIDRIELRNREDIDIGNLDRNDRYFWIVNRIKNKFHFDWVDIDTTNNNVDSITKEINNIVRSRKNGN